MSTLSHVDPTQPPYWPSTTRTLVRRGGRCGGRRRRVALYPPVGPPRAHGHAPVRPIGKTTTEQQQQERTRMIRRACLDNFHLFKQVPRLGCSSSTGSWSVTWCVEELGRDTPMENPSRHQNHNTYFCIAGPRAPPALRRAPLHEGARLRGGGARHDAHRGSWPLAGDLQALRRGKEARG